MLGILGAGEGVPLCGESNGGVAEQSHLTALILAGLMPVRAGRKHKDAQVQPNWSRNIGPVHVTMGILAGYNITRRF